MGKCCHLTKKEQRCSKKAVYNSSLCTVHTKSAEKMERLSHSYLHNNPTEIIEGLFLGSISRACDEKWLKENNIKYVINACDEEVCKYPKTINYVFLDIEDTENENIAKYLDITAKLIDTSLKNKKGIFIHCHMGISRSATLVWYWLTTRKFSKDYNCALTFLESRRPIVNPNEGFKKQIISKVSSAR